MIQLSAHVCMQASPTPTHSPDATQETAVIESGSVTVQPLHDAALGGREQCRLTGSVDECCELHAGGCGPMHSLHNAELMIPCDKYNASVKLG